MPEITERPVTYTVDPGWSMPDLGPGVRQGGVVELGERGLEATYFDTEGQVLTRLGVTLRRRRGGADAGWQLVIPNGASGTEVRSRSRQGTPPKAFLALLEGVCGGDPVGVVATISTTRQVHRILDPDGALVVEVADDDVHGAATGAEARIDAWREIEVAGGPAGDEETVAAVRKLLRRAGARKDAMQAGLARVLVAEESAAEDDAVAGYLRLQCERILLGEVRLRDEPSVEGIHDTRVAIRRLRSVLRMFAPMLEGVPEELDEDLRWLAGLLHAVRDVDVLAAHLDRKVDALAVELVMGPVKQELAQTLGSDRKDALRRWAEARGDERYRHTLGAVLACHREPPVAGARGKALRRRRETILVAAQGKARKRLAAAGDDPTRLHRARKAVKRLRYTAEALGAEVPRSAKTAHHAEELQGVLGDHQDLVVEAAFLRRVAAMFGGREGHNGFTYGILLAEAEQEAAQIRSRRPRW